MKFKFNIKAKKPPKKEKLPRYTDAQISRSSQGDETLLIKNSFSKLKNLSKEQTSMIYHLLSYTDEKIVIEIEMKRKKMAWAKERKKWPMYHVLREKVGELIPKAHVEWFNQETGVFPTGHLDLVRAELEKLGIKLKIDDLRNYPGKMPPYRWRNKPHAPRYYQKEAVDIALKKHRGVIESSPGTGKTLEMAMIIKELGARSLIVCPASDILIQTYDRFCEWFGENKVQKLSSAQFKTKTPSLKDIRLINIQSLASLYKNGKAQEILKDLHLICIDEIHHAGSESYTKLLRDIDHIYYRFGFSGTFLRNDSKTLDMWGFLSNHLYHYPAYLAVKEGFLTPAKLIVTNLPGFAHRNYALEYKGNYCQKGGALLIEIVEIIAETDPKNQILIMVDLKEKGGEYVHKYLAENGIKSTWISGDDKKEDVKKAIEDFNQKKIRVLIGSKVIGEGVDICSTDILILANGGKSPIKFVQAIGRAVRLHPGKKKAEIYDFCFDGTNYMHKHSEERINHFKNYFDGEIFRRIQNDSE